LPRGRCGSPEEPLDALHGAVAEVDRQRGGQEPEVPRDRRQRLVVVFGFRLGLVRMTGVDDAAARRAGPVDLHRRRREEPVARVAPRHPPIGARRYWMRRTGSPRMYADQVVVSVTLVPAGYVNLSFTQHPVANVVLHV